jgi:GNAT superfamily N-acetyltransferase
MEHTSLSLSPRIRRIRTTDQAALSRFYEGLSEDSRFARFHAVNRGIGDETARRLCGADHDHREGFIAEVEASGADRPEIVGHLCLEPGDVGVEMAIAVADAWQRHGIGRALLDAAVTWMEQHGVRVLEASMLSTNTAVLRLIAALGRPVRMTAPGAGVIEATIELAPVAAAPDRAAPESAGVLPIQRYRHPAAGSPVATARRSRDRRALRWSRRAPSCRPA